MERDGVTNSMKNIYVVERERDFSIQIFRAERLLKTIARDFFVVEIRAVLNEGSE